ncbi:MAG: hypothetical protein ACHQDE_00780 [Acidimicrobiia bacterium]
MEIAESARKHGISDEAIQHAIRVPLRHVRQDDRLFVIGADETGRLLEVVVLDPDTDPIVIHAMPLRAKFYDLLG